MRIKRLLTVSIASIAVTAGTVVAAPTASGAPCGFYVESNQALYNHCGSAQTITIAVRYAGISRGDDRCVGRGITTLDRQDRPADRLISNAWWLHDAC